MRSLPPIVCVALVCLAPACRKPEPKAAAPSPAPAPEAAGPSGPASAQEKAADDEEVHPVYPAGEAIPEATALCHALHGLPAERRAACCKGTASPGILETQCTAVVSAALRSRGVRLERAAVERCAAAQARALSGCAYIGQWLLPLPAECQGLFSGARKSGELCRSSLECNEGLTCLGIGPTAAGVCGAPRSDGQACLTGVDPLASYTRQDTEAHHPECAGYCGHRRCTANAAPGAACTLARECPRGQHCAADHCAAGAFAAAGEACVGDACAAGLRCIAGKCSAPKPEGASCKNDYECLGGCVPATHVCGMRCDAY